MSDDPMRPQGSLRMPDWMPRPNIPDNIDIRKEDGLSIGRSDMADKRHLMNSTKEQWERIFGKHTQGAGRSRFKF